MYPAISLLLFFVIDLILNSRHVVLSIVLLKLKVLCPAAATSSYRRYLECGSASEKKFHLEYSRTDKFIANLHNNSGLKLLTKSSIT